VTPALAFLVPTSSFELWFLYSSEREPSHQESQRWWKLYLPNIFSLILSLCAETHSSFLSLGLAGTITVWPKKIQNIPGQDQAPKWPVCALQSRLKVEPGRIHDVN
jgi:hypothetical protein